MSVEYRRGFVGRLERRFSDLDPLIQIVIGPRQVGKTTGVMQFLSTYSGESYYVSADDVLSSDSIWIYEQWQMARSKSPTCLLVIDEIQKIENWSETIKKLWDGQRQKTQKLSLLLLGSSALMLSKGTSESLLGRFEMINVPHWDFIESTAIAPISLEMYLRYGGYPKSYDFLSDLTRLEQYLRNSVINRVIERDILQYVTVKKPALFRQAFEIISCYPAQEISYRKLLGQLQDKGNVELIKYYLSLYEDAMLVKTLGKYSRQSFKVKSSSPKILLMAPCLHYLFVSHEEKADFVFENTVGVKLLTLSDRLYYWRSSHYEVDFVLEWQRKVYAIEVKSGHTKRLSGLKKFMEAYPDAVPVIINRENYDAFLRDPGGMLS